MPTLNQRLVLYVMRQYFVKHYPSLRSELFVAQIALNLEVRVGMFDDMLPICPPPHECLVTTGPMAADRPMLLVNITDVFGKTSLVLQNFIATDFSAIQRIVGLRAMSVSLVSTQN